MAAEVKSVLFVCLGNICRSPIAEAVFRKLVTDENIENKWRIDSAATSTYEIGNPPDFRGQTCMRKHGITMNHIARQCNHNCVRLFSLGSTFRSREPRGKIPYMSEMFHVCSQPRGDFQTPFHPNLGKFNHNPLQITKDDFLTFDYILCMDESNLRDLKRKSNQIKNCTAKIELLGSYDPQKQLIIEDPYYGNEKDFETVYEQCVRCCKAFLEKSC